MDDTGIYTLPVGTVIWPGGYLLLFRVETRLILSDYADQVTLSRPDGSLVDRFEYIQGPGPDRSYCRNTDGSGSWTRDCVVTPGDANRLLPPREPADARDDTTPGRSRATPPPYAAETIAAARARPPNTGVTIIGAVTMPPGLFGRSIYVEDASGGIRVYLQYGEYPALALGDRVRITGRLRLYYGELEIYVSSPRSVTRISAGETVAPRWITTGRTGAADAGQLIAVAGPIVGFHSSGWIIDDGSGQLRIYFPDELPWHRPYVRVGDLWAATGVVSPYASDATQTPDYRVIVRFADDVSQPPLFLPVTGRSC